MLAPRSCWRRAWLHLYTVIYSSISISHQCCQGCPLNIAIKAKSASFDSINCFLRHADRTWISLITHWKSSWILHWSMRWGRLNAWWDKLNIPIENDLHSVWCIMHFLLLIHVIGSLIWNLFFSSPYLAWQNTFIIFMEICIHHLVSYCSHCWDLINTISTSYEWLLSPPIHLEFHHLCFSRI